MAAPDLPSLDAVLTITDIEYVKLEETQPHTRVVFELTQNVSIGSLIRFPNLEHVCFVTNGHSIAIGDLKCPFDIEPGAEAPLPDPAPGTDGDTPEAAHGAPYMNEELPICVHAMMCGKKMQISDLARDSDVCIDVAESELASCPE